MTLGIGSPSAHNPRTRKPREVVPTDYVIQVPFQLNPQAWRDLLADKTTDLLVFKDTGEALKHIRSGNEPKVDGPFRVVAVKHVGTVTTKTTTKTVIE